MDADVVTIAERLMRQPAAPYREEYVGAEVEAICSEHRLSARRDSYGNILVSTGAKTRSRALVLAAHMDHPGFGRFRKQSNVYVADFLGGVGDKFFKKGVRLRLHPGDLPARLGARVGSRKRFEINVAGSLEQKPDFGVWDLESFAVRRRQIHGRSCDDLIGVATILACLIELRRKSSQVHVIGAISRAEEVGFQGALMIAEAKEIPADALVISLETSRELPPVQMGKGVIVRVGDRSSVFDSEATRFLTALAQKEAAPARSRKNQFQFQRALMSGGTCEGTAYQEAGYQTAAVCVALGNYHNCAAGGKIAAEFVSIEDVRSMVHLMVAAARGMSTYKKVVGRLNASLEKLTRAARRSLRGLGA